jgi:hypothetical protein
MRRTLVTVAVVATVSSVGAALRTSSWGVGVLGAVFFLVLAAVMVAYVRRVGLVLTEREVVATGWGRNRRHPRAAVARVLRATIAPSRGRPYDNLFLLDAYGRVLVRLYGIHYTAADIDRLLHVLGVPCVGPDRPLAPAEFDRFHPGMLLWIERRPGLFAALLLVGVLPVVVAAVLIAMWAQGAL